ncbi:phosphatidylinositol phospholipase C KNAG_0E02820 [Huiozyma naganishii CBS 8797]|uniref:Phosphoinositide phospholipase C n=1 Tax=Huiozyma naganishii (strain ATCC MYA-139 / BCRC 22969 / CBS 8797 / KCTC 17520 / NBRC 10181 / NCYC 3082 / Yp74L-3) TaxID=1071383 RepID=J7S7W7_HUIN7|nr:hypothetical protein KNAG_0E02820 [Kazachstania naganishii CBS 8797]CCK70541.1 hypothetical protein KNAG_0E02820 [Kazachstania naganishii CBS 8797]
MVPSDAPNDLQYSASVIIDKTSSTSQNNRSVLKTLIRKTTDLAQGANHMYNGGPNNEYDQSVGPLTHSHSFDDLFAYMRTRNISLNKRLRDLCQSLHRDGIQMRKVTRRKRVLYTFKIDSDCSKLLWKAESKSLLLDSIKDIRIGEMASNYREEYSIGNEYTDLWITIIYTVNNDKLKALHVIAKNKQDFDTFFKCVCGIVRLRKDLMEGMLLPSNSQFASIHWHSTVSNKNEDETKDTLTFCDVKRLCDMFHIYCSSSHLKKIFEIADMNQNRLLNFTEFQLFVKLLKERKEIHLIWLKLTDSKEYMDLQMFRRFFVETQGEPASSENSVVREFNKYSTEGHMNEEQFTKFLTAQEHLNDIRTITDLTKPLNHYFIASSHNTYLLGKQIGETPSVEGYVHVLQQGCRCIEIDIWDGESGPVVCHGALTASISLKNVVEVIKKYAFITSPYPLVISLEINCSQCSQNAASSIIKETLGDFLYRGDDKNDNLPSPLALKHKIIMKVKKPKKVSFQYSGQNSSSSKANLSSSSSQYDFATYSLNSSNDSEVDVKVFAGKNPKCTPTTKRQISSDDLVSTRSDLVSGSASTITRIKRIGLKKRVETTDDMFEISGMHGIKFRNFSLPESKTLMHCFSLNEKQLSSMMKDVPMRLSVDKHNRRYLMRVYPHALRYKSSNFNPINFWKMGVQMVATNWQTNDLGQQIILAMFQLMNPKNEHLHSGYILKPKMLLNRVCKARDIPVLYRSLKERAPRQYKIKISIISAQLLPRLKSDFKTEAGFGPSVTLDVISDEESYCPSISISENGTLLNSRTAVTKTCEGNGFNPIWDMEVNFILKDLNFTFLRFVINSNGMQLATNCIKLEYLKRGYRHIPLYNSRGEQYIFSTLFIYSSIDTND